MSNQGVNRTRRRLIVATSVVGGAGVLAAAWPFIASMNPSQRAKAAGAPVEVDISKIEPGSYATVEWRGKPVWVIYRTKEMLDLLDKHDDRLSDPKSESSIQPEYCKNHRAIKPEYMVVIGICTHLGCSPSPKLKPVSDNETGPDWHGGFYCPCHGSRFDLAARVFKGSPAPTNMVVPPHRYVTDTRILIGEDTKGA
ncbi:MAG: ubiquinol-cytochrome c reductase iron-sulfur subunit [Burkholderiales bacterium]